MCWKSANEVNKPKKPVGPKIITTIFLAADNVAAAKNNVGIIFGPPGFFVNSNGSRVKFKVKSFCVKSEENLLTPFSLNFDT